MGFKPAFEISNRFIVISIIIVQLARQLLRFRQIGEFIRRLKSEGLYLFELARGQQTGRLLGDAASITLFKSVGAALEDLAAAELAIEA